jgi:amino-acid N-acetyltransferase
MAKKQRDNFLFRRAGIKDVPTIGSIINGYAEYGIMLHRSSAYLFEHVRDFHVAVDKDQVIGVCGLNIVWSNMAEVYALAVSPSHRGQGVGKRLVLHCVDEGEDLGIRKLMTLTYEQKFFERCGFSVIDRQSLPLKVWSECVQCPKNQACDEIAMIRINEDVPDFVVAQPQVAQPDKYEVPVPLIISTLAKPAQAPTG